MNNLLINKFSQRVVSCLTRGGHSGSIDNLIIEIGKEALLIKSEELHKSSIYVHPEQITTNEELDENGISRFRLGQSDEGACMIPDRKGYWTRAQ